MHPAKRSDRVCSGHKQCDSPRRDRTAFLNKKKERKSPVALLAPKEGVALPPWPVYYVRSAPSPRLARKKRTKKFRVAAHIQLRQSTTARSAETKYNGWRRMITVRLWRFYTIRWPVSMSRPTAYCYRFLQSHLWLYDFSSTGLQDTQYTVKANPSFRYEGKTEEERNLVIFNDNLAGP